MMLDDDDGPPVVLPDGRCQVPHVRFFACRRGVFFLSKRPTANENNQTGLTHTLFFLLLFFLHY
jgi:hypothetical protein